MPLGRPSRARLATCHPDLIRLVEAVADGIDRGALRTAGITDITVVTGHRNEADQNREYAEGDSKLQWPRSKHNSTPARAVDIAPYPTRWADRQAFHVLRGYVLAIADRIGIRIRVISWDGPHYELVDG
jgi:peptidoglycan L-alanyl-D-glutamate endopeptidase CwlK